jgi:hypothetical protein
MDPPINYSAAISPVCLPPFNNAADQFVNQDAVVIGWGREFSGKYKTDDKFHMEDANEAEILTEIRNYVIRYNLLTYNSSKAHTLSIGLKLQRIQSNLLISIVGQLPTVIATVLKQATVQISSKAKCNNIWAFSLSPFTIFNQHICAGSDGKDRPTCPVSSILPT